MTRIVSAIALALTASITSATAQTAPAAAAAPAAPAAAATPAKPVAGASSAESRSAAALAQSPYPVMDQGTTERLTSAIERYKGLVASGGWPIIPRDANATGPIPASSDVLRKRLMASGDLHDDGNVTDAVKTFQARHGLTETGTVGPKTLAALNVPAEKRLTQLEASLKRVEALGFKFGKRYVLVNIPAAFVEAIENDVVVRRYRVIVGKSENPSPTVTAHIASVNLNPNWTVPSSIVKNEIAGHMRKDPGYLERMHMQVFDARNQVIDAKTVDWTNTKTLNVTVRQLPGEWNALGRVKIDMPNSYAVYMHDTNQRNLFTNDYRFDSHGCARIDNVRDLAAWLLDDVPYWDKAQIDDVIASGDRVDVKLTNRVPVAWVYMTAWVTRDGTVQFRNDIYDQDAQLTEASAEASAFFKNAIDRAGGSAVR